MDWTLDVLLYFAGPAVLFVGSVVTWWVDRPTGEPEEF